MEPCNSIVSITHFSIWHANKNPIVSIIISSQASTASASETIPHWKRLAGAVGIATAGTGAALAYGESIPLMAEEEALHPPHYGWNHKGNFDTFDHGSIRRGYEVYRQVCAACHSMDRIAFRNLVDVIYSEDEVKVSCSS